MSDEPIRDQEFDALLDELEDAGYVERYTSDDGQETMRLTRTGEHAAQQLAMLADDDAAALLAGLLGDEVEEEGDR